jgi:hypothetical protein
MARAESALSKRREHRQFRQNYSDLVLAQLFRPEGRFPFWSRLLVIEMLGCRSASCVQTMQFIDCTRDPASFGGAAEGMCKDSFTISPLPARCKRNRAFTFTMGYHASCDSNSGDVSYLAHLRTSDLSFLLLGAQRQMRLVRT